MSGGEKRGGKPFEWTKSGENTSNSTSFSGSEPGSEFDLTRAGAGPTIEGGSGSAGGGGGRAGDNREVSGRSQHSQQLKYYGRRNRAKQAVSVQVPESNDVEVEGAGLVGFLAVDLTEQLESGIDPTREQSLAKRNGSGGMASGKGTSRLERAGSSREVKMGQGLFDGAKNKDGPEAVAAVDTGKTIEVSRIAEIPLEDSRVLEEKDLSHLDFQEDRRKNGILNDRRGDNKSDPAVQSLEGYECAEASYATPNARPSDSEEAAGAVEEVFQERSIGKDSASSSSRFLTGDQGTPDADDGDVEYTGTKLFGNSDITDGKALLEEAGLDHSSSPPSTGLGFPSNGEQDRNRKKGPGGSSSRSRRAPGQCSKEGNDHSGGETSKGSEDQESSVLKGMPLEWRLALERRQYEESVLAKADDVWAKQEILDSTKKIPSKGKEPARCKTHWDFVLEEMTWLAKDFERERKWKLSQAKKVAIRVSRSKLDVEAKGLRRQKEEEQKTRRVASNIAKDVKKFWMKVEKLVMYKHQLELEERRKKALDKHLDFLLGQTERYSTMLAENLGGEISAPSVPKSLLPVPVPTGFVSGGGDISAVGKEIVVRDEALGTTTTFPVGRDETLALVSEDRADAKEIFRLESEFASTSRADLQEDVVKSEADVGDEDFNMDNEEEEEDDEATIEAEEALVTKEEQREELSVLQREGELPLEELMKFYGRNGDESDETDDFQDEEEDEDRDDYEQNYAEQGDSKFENHVQHSSSQQVDTNLTSSSIRDKVEVLFENGNLDAVGSVVIANVQGVETPPVTLSVHDDPVLAGSAAANVQSASDPSMEVPPNKQSTSGSPNEADLALKKRRRNGDVSGRYLLEESKDLYADDKEYIPAALVGGSDEDDETTLEEEESLAKAEAADHADEIDRLKKESEMSIEELLAQYRSMGDGPEAEEDFEDVEDDYVEDRQDRTSEAGTSGSSEDDGDVGYKYLAEDSDEAKERMGEPSTSGREKWSLVSSGYGRKPKKKSIEMPDTIEERKGGRVGNRIMVTSGRASGGEEKKAHSRVKTEPTPQVGIAENGSLGKTSDLTGSSGVSLLLGADDVVDQATAEALARVSAAAKRRGERVLKRAQREEETRTSLDAGEENLAGGKAPEVIARADAFEGDTPLFEHSRLFENEVEDLTVDDGHIVQGMPVKSSPSGAAELMASDPTETGEEKTSEDKLADAAAAAQSAQPTGYTFSTTKVRTKLPFLLKHSLREYQHIGLDWLVTMYDKRLNGILADEMGLGKTIMTISLLAHLACDRGIWGPHLIVVPTSVMLNWETEFMKWCPAFKILTYFGSAKERKFKRQGWSKPNSFHVCITTYRLVIQDAKAFKRKKWKYLILDEAHLIKNWKSQRWQTLLNFNAKRRILLTGTPLQNDLMELWSLMHFLMPHVFQSHQEFRDWFSNPITGMVEGQEQINKEVVDRLHNVLRPFLLRRLKKDVEKQLPQKYEHVIHCRLSKRQRNLYEDFMASSDTQATLSSGNFLGLINVLMQLRKVCNHPDLFEGRPIVSSFDMVGLDLHLSSPVASALQFGPFVSVNFKELNLLVSQVDLEMTTWECEEASDLCTPGALIEELSSTGEDSWDSKQNEQLVGEGRGIIEEIQAVIRAERARQKKEKAYALIWLNMLRCKKNMLYGSDLRKCVSVEDPVHDVHKIKADPRRFLEYSSVLADIVHLPLTRLQMSMSLVESFVFAIPAARAPTPVAWCSHPPSPSVLMSPTVEGSLHEIVSASLEPLRPVFVRRQLFFPDRRLLQFDCGKLQQLAVLLRRLKSEGHRALIFTQMTRMLDVLESFINLYGYTYMRLDGSTKPEQRQILMQRFNTNPKIFLFILSTRSGGVGINLVGADTVIFYDSDWNPAMDQQAQDRCHRIGQTREVHIYRLVSESTIEENILKKANQKRMLDDLVIQSGSYNTEFFKKLDPMELFSGLKGVKVGGGSKNSGLLQASESEVAHAVKPSELSSADVEAALKNAEDEADYMAMKRVEQEEAAENQEFTEEGFVGNMEDEELVDDMEEGKTVVGKNQLDGVLKEGVDIKLTVTPEEAPQVAAALIPAADAEEEMDMLADVKQMAAAAAAAGRGSISFEDQLQPVERYAMRFLELWDPRVDKASEAAQVLFEEKEWELDQLEKLKEEQEAEIDEDNEPLFYESWDTAFANEAYRQQVEVLAQQQENQRQLEWEAMEEEMRDADRAVAEAASAVVGAENFKVKSKSLKKLKKTKFKSLKKGSLTSDDVLVKRNIHRDESYSNSQFELSSLPSRSPSQRKRKAPKLLEEEMLTEVPVKKSKKEIPKDRLSGDKMIMSKRLSEFDQFGGGSDDDTRDSDVMPTPSKFPTSISTKKKTGGKISIMAVPLKKGPLIMLEKERKKDATRMHEHVPAADPWIPAEDAILCAVVHEYGGNWQLASDALAGVPDGNIYRGRHRHPLHCRERFRQLLAQNAASAGDPSSDKNAFSAASNAHMKVTEEHTKRLLDVVLQLPDNEPLLQRHFAAILTAVQNKLARNQTGLDKTSLGGSKGGTSPEGGDFIPCPCFSHIVSSPYVAPGNRVFAQVQLVAEALTSANLDENAIVDSMDVLPSTSTSRDEQVPAEIEPEEDKENVMDYLESDVFPIFASAGGLEFQKSVHTYLSLSVEDIFQCTPTTSPTSPPANALRDFAEITAEHRFRTAMNSGWGPGVYDWAGSAISGLGSASMPSKAKSKKRPPPADASKASKPKQPRIPKVSKKLPAEISVQVLAESSGAANGADVHVGEDRDSGSVPLQPALNHGASIGKEAKFGELLQNLPTGQSEPREKVVEKNTSLKGNASGEGSLSKKKKKLNSVGGNAVGVITPAGMSKVKTVKLKSGDSVFGAVVKNPTGVPSTVEVVDDIDVVRVVTKSFCEVSPLADVETLSPDIGSAFDDLSESGSDDEVVITGVSYPHAGRSDLVSQVQSSVKKPNPQAKSDRSPVAYLPVERLQSDKSGNSRIKEGGSLGPKGTKQKSWPEVANFPRFPQNIQLEVPVSVSGWVPKAGGDTSGISQSSRAEVIPVAVIPVIAKKISSSPQRIKKGAGRPPVTSTVGIEHMSPASSRSVKESQPFVPWAPPVGMWPTSAPSFQSLNFSPESRNRNSSDVLKRASSSNMPNVPPVGHFKVRSPYEASSVGHTAGHSSPRATLPYTSASSNVPATLDNYVTVKAGGSHFLQLESEEDLPSTQSSRTQLGQGPAPHSVGVIQDRTSHLDLLQDIQLRSTFNSGSSGSVVPGPSPSKRPSLLSSSPLSHTEHVASHHSLSQSAASQREISGGPDLGLSLGRSPTVSRSSGKLQP